MGFKNSRARKWLAGALAGVTLSAAALGGCALGSSTGDDVETAAGEIIADPRNGEGAEANPTHAEGTEGVGDGSSEEINEALMSSPVIPLDQTWTGNLGGLDVAASYDTATQTVRTTVRNTTTQTLCYVQSEPHMKAGAQTVGELGPEKLGDLAPGQSATSVLSVADEPAMAGVAFDGYVVHMEVFDCNGPGPIPHSGGEGGEGAEGAGGHAEGNEASGENGGESGGERGGEVTEAGGENDTAVALTPGQTYDVTRNGARLVLAYDPAANTFNGTVTNTTNSVLTRARVEIHLSNGTELGPTTPTDLAPGQTLRISLPATQAPFTTWSPHAEVGSGEGGEGGTGGGESSERAGGHAEGNEGGGESGREGGSERSGEHGSGGEGSAG
ncbi:FxLYD domain-containing protein [Candidatus Poriferisodalis sp.]|uniref:FxLYD domain-containing protein n=1 Tax=Candidatus Poriferisodalis sp. TaxID=3101277 RepID=UPI003B022F23